MMWRDSTTGKEELFNTITQIVGVLLGSVALTVLLQPSIIHDSRIRLFGNIIYGITLILMFLTSGLFHGFYFTKANKVLYILDNAAIFVFIAGTFTPFNLTLLHGAIRTLTLISVWLFAVFGILYSVFHIHESDIPFAMYLVFGWIGLIIVYPLAKQTSFAMAALFIAGGILYSPGTVFLQSKKIRYHHGIWHLFILAASTLHFIAILHL